MPKIEIDDPHKVTSPVNGSNPTVQDPSQRIRSAPEQLNKNHRSTIEKLVTSSVELMSLVLSFLTTQDIVKYRCYEVSQVWSEACSRVHDISIKFSNDPDNQYDRDYMRMIRMTRIGEDLKSIEIQWPGTKDVLDINVANTVRDYLLPRCHKLRHFTLDTLQRRKRYATMLHPIESLSNLKTLKLTNCSFDNTDECTMLIRNKPQLEVLRFQSARFNLSTNAQYGEFHQAIGKLHKLRELMVTGIFCSGIGGGPPCPLYPMFTELKELRYVRMGDVDDDCLEAMARHCPNLKQLYLQYCRKISMSGVLKVLAACPIEEVSISTEDQRFYDETDMENVCLAGSALTSLEIRVIPHPINPPYFVSSRVEKLQDIARCASNGRVSVKFI